ncbi:MAG: hypothetical protein ACTTGJ_03680 [Clostridium sp.]
MKKVLTKTIIANDSKTLVKLFAANFDNKFYVEFIEELERLIKKFQEIYEISNRPLNIKCVNLEELERYIQELKLKNQILLSMYRYKDESENFIEVLNEISDRQLVYLNLLYNQLSIEVSIDKIASNNMLHIIMQEYNIEFPENVFQIDYITDGILDYLISNGLGKEKLIKRIFNRLFK